MKNVQKNAYFLKVFYLTLIFQIIKTQVDTTTKQHSLEVENKEYKEEINKIIINGNTKINDIYYETQCKCSELPTSINPEDAFCSPNQLKLKQDKDGDGATFEQVRLLIGNISELQFADPIEEGFRCMDGRENGDILATPGGDAGEFLLALYIYEGMTRELDQNTIDTIFQQYLRWMKQSKFYMCTDDDAISHLEKETGISLNINILRLPKKQDQKDLLKALKSAENQGDKHLKSLIKNSNLYSIRGELVQQFITTFYKILWNIEEDLRQKLNLENLVGESMESAFLEIRSNEICAQMNLAPKLNSKKRIENKNLNIQAFINHIDAVSQIRKRLALFFSQEVNHHQQPIDPDVMFHRMNKHGLSFLEITGSRVAKYLPFYSLDLV